MPLCEKSAICRPVVDSEWNDPHFARITTLDAYICEDHMYIKLIYTLVTKFWENWFQILTKENYVKQLV